MPTAAALFTRPPASYNTIQYNYLFIYYIFQIFQRSARQSSNCSLVVQMTYFRYSRDHLHVTRVRMERARSSARKMPSIRSQSSSVDTGAAGVTTAALARYLVPTLAVFIIIPISHFCPQDLANKIAKPSKGHDLCGQASQFHIYYTYCV